MKKWISRLLRRGASEPQVEREETFKVGQPAEKKGCAYSSDQPISSRNEDRFNRWAFAERIADTLAGRSDAASIVIGLYGPWGDGKTSTLRLIQVFLHLPPPDEIALRQMTFEGVDAALSQSGTTLSQEHVDAFVRHFVDGIELQLHTPRHAKLYVNALTFALPLLKGEAHPVDLMLIEGIRIFYPKLYTAIRDNPEYFLNPGGDRYEQEAHRQRATAIIDGALEGIGVLDAKQVRARLLEVLFPRLSNMGYGHDWDRRWDREQRICSDKYFKRYFTYSVPPGDVSDIVVEKFLETVVAMNLADVDETLKGFSARSAMPQLIRKLRNRENDVEAAAARSLALGVARNGMLVPRERAMLISDWTFRQAAVLVAHLVRRVPAGEARETLADMVIKEVLPLPFGLECLRWMRHDEKEPEEEWLISSAGEERTAAAMAHRIRAEAFNSPLYQKFGKDAPWLYWLWNKQDGGHAVADHLRARFEEHPNEVDSFLDTFVGEAWGMESGLPHPADFRRESYDAVAMLIDPGFLLSNLKQRYGVELDAPEFHHDPETLLSRRIAHQFAFMHLKVGEENQAETVLAEAREQGA
jgi:hypothetical protein